VRTYYRCLIYRHKTSVSRAHITILLNNITLFVSPPHEWKKKQKSYFIFRTVVVKRNKNVALVWRRWSKTNRIHMIVTHLVFELGNTVQVVIRNIIILQLVITITKIIISYCGGPIMLAFYQQSTTVVQLFIAVCRIYILHCGVPIIPIVYEMIVANDVGIPTEKDPSLMADSRLVTIYNIILDYNI